ncbi:SAR2788 family putative toxin [Lysinibacillus sp. NPDC048646]|uniref:SAR2788 family putative toxin n=1 Tax=Lysinibacillus sp. NPDC048646 TaxID=3390574 RepID=UPI003D06FC06
MKKFIAILLSVSLFIAYGGVGYATSIENEGPELVQLNTEENNLVSNSEIVEHNYFIEGDSKYVESSLNTEEITIISMLEFNEDTDTITVSANLDDKYGNSVDKKFDVTLLSITDEDNFKASFIDHETGEEYLYDSAELQASVWPVVGVIVGFIAKQGLKQALKKWGKSVVASMIRSVPAVAKEAAKDLGYSLVENQYSHGAKIFYNKKGKPKYISIDQDGHNGGVWKGADSIKNLGSKKTRSGTYDAELNKIGD